MNTQVPQDGLLDKINNVDRKLIYTPSYSPPAYPRRKQRRSLVWSRVIVISSYPLIRAALESTQLRRASHKQIT